MAGADDRSDDEDALKAALQQLCRRDIAPDGAVSALTRLSGGANMQSWRFDFAGQAYVLRRLPPGLRDGIEEAAEAQALPLAAQADLIALARAHGVKAPAVRARIDPEAPETAALGDGFVMDCVPGEALPHKLLREPGYARARAGLAQAWAEQLARIHALPHQTLPEASRALLPPFQSPASTVAALAERYAALGGASPVLAMAFGWLSANAPAPAKPALCHGDFRMGNLLVDTDGLTAVLDWELAHLGDPVQDLAYGCMPGWRFGQYDRTLGGFDQAETLLDHYAAATGRAVDPARFRFWLVYASLWWGICCLNMAQIWRSGGDRSLERAVIGRRVSEVEIDLMLLLEAECLAAAGGDGAAIADPAPTPLAGSGETHPAELIRALREWVETDIAAQAEGHRLFAARVAINALGMAERHAETGPVQEQAARQRLAALGMDAKALHARLLSDGPAALDRALLDHLRRLALERCTLDQPRYAGLRVARARWCC